MVRPFSRKAKKDAPQQIDDEVLEEVIDGVGETLEEPVDQMGQPSEEQFKADIPFDELSI